MPVWRGRHIARHEPEGKTRLVYCGPIDAHGLLQASAMPQELIPMLADRSQRLLKVAAAETMKRIQLDRKRAPQRIKTLLTHIEQNLFDHALDVNQLKRSCGVRDNSVPIQFHAELGLPPHAYIEDCRLQTACRLLRDSDLKVWQIAELLGYSSIQVFSRAFTRWAGVRPTTFRKDQRRRAAKLGVPAAAHSAGAWTSKAEGSNGEKPAPASLSEDVLHRALDGTLEGPQAQQLIKKLLRIYPTSGAETPSAAVRARLLGSAGLTATEDDEWTEIPNTIAAGRIEEIKIDVVLEELDRRRSWKAKRELVRCQLRLASPMLFCRLQEQSAATLAAGDSEKSLHMAQLALDAAEDAFDSTRSPDALRVTLKAGAWTSIGYAQLAASNDRGCDETLSTIERLVATGHVEARTEARYLTLRAARCRTRAQPAQALRHLERAHTLFEASGDDHDLTRIYAALGTAHVEAGQRELGLQHLNKALDGITDGHQPDMQLAIYVELIDAYHQAAQLQQAKALLEQALEIETTSSPPCLRARLRALEAKQAASLERPADAEPAWQDSLQQLIEIGEPHEAALVCFDLASFYATLARDTARRQLEGMLTVFEPRAEDEEAALRHVRGALGPRALDPIRGKEVRTVLQTLVRQHRARQVIA